MKTNLHPKSHDIEAWLAELGMPSADRDYKPGHQRVISLIQSLEATGEVFHRPKLRIRVAGTNGKGSTCHYIASALQANGLKVGMYTSPHIHTFNERIQIQKEHIHSSDLVALMAKVMPLAMEAGTTYFETATVLALLHFSRSRVDVEILEAGVGARLDATTAVPADMGLLTAVAMDHEAWLGEVIEEIAADKAHVFDGCRICCSLPQTASVTDVIHNMRSDICFSEPYVGKLLLQGEHQKRNAGLAFCALKELNRNEILKNNIDLLNCAQAVAETTVPGRFERIPFKGQLFYLDAAHNEHAVSAVLDLCREQAYIFDAIFVRTREDRDLSRCLPDLQRYAKKVVDMTGEGKHAYPGMAEALSAETSASPQGKFLVLGSFITLNETRSWMKQAQ